MTNPKITFDHHIELLLEKHTSEMSYDLAKAVINQFGGVNAFEKAYQHIFDIGIESVQKKDLQQWETNLTAFYKANKKEIDAYIKEIALADGNDSAIGMLDEDFYELRHLDADDIAEGWHNTESKNHDTVVSNLANFTGEMMCRYCAEYMDEFGYEEEEEDED